MSESEKQAGTVDASSPGDKPPVSTKERTFTRQNIFFVMVLMAAAMLGASIPYVKDIFHGNRPGVQATMPVVQPIVVIDSDQVSVSAMKAMQGGPDAAVLAQNAGAVGEVVGRTIKGLAADYAARGYLVLDSSSVLGAPPAINITAQATQSVLNALHELAVAANQPATPAPKSPSAPAVQQPNRPLP